MKFKISPVFFLAAAIFILWTACDEIDEPIVIVSEQYSTDGYLDTLYYIDSVSITTKQVLLEDFTGHKCVNCPEAALAAQDLAESLDNRLVIYSVHAGYYAEPDASGYYTADYRCPVSEQLYNDFQAFANPIGLINRVVYNGSRLVGAGNWETVVMQELAKPNRTELTVRNIYYPNLGKVQTDVYIRFLLPEEDKFTLVMFIAEAGIVSPQKNNNPAIGPSPDWLDYEHHNILRGSLNAAYGGYFTEDGTVNQNEDYHSQFIFTPDTTWVTANCRIMSYILNETSGEVYQVAEAGIKVSE
jgi:hypothetical protein